MCAFVVTCVNCCVCEYMCMYVSVSICGSTYDIDDKDDRVSDKPWF